MSTSTDDNASLPSAEACEKVAGEQQAISDATTHTELVVNASLSSIEACEMVSVAEEQPIVAGEQLADDHDTSLNISFPSLTSSEACGGDIQHTPTNSQLVTPSLTPLGAWTVTASLQQEDNASTSPQDDFEMIELPSLNDMALD